MKLNKKGAELSMNVIIIAAIALLVLVILAVLLFNTGDSVQQGRSCESLSRGPGTWECAPECDNGYTLNPAGQCPTEGDRCCTQLFG